MVSNRIADPAVNRARMETSPSLFAAGFSERRPLHVVMVGSVSW
jgi:hypothetical protein